MNIEHLREFVEVAHCLSYATAARNLNMTQSSLSKHISALEKECEAPLFKRTSSRVRLTNEGHVLLEEVIDLLDAHDSALERVRSLKTKPALTVGGLYKNPIVLSMMGRALSALKEEGNPLFIAYQDFRHQPYLELVSGGTVDMVITMIAPDERIPDDLTCVPLFQDPMIAMVREGHPFGRGGTARLADLNGHTIISPVGSYSVSCGKKTVRYIFTKHGARPKAQQTFLRSILDLSTVHNDDEIFIMESSLVKTQPFAEGYVPVKFEEEDALFSFYAVFRTDNESTALAKLVEHLVSE